jgi:hypothetical protein
LKRGYITEFPKRERTLKKRYLKRIPDKVGIKSLSNVTRGEFKNVRTIYDLMTLMDKHIMGILRPSEKAKGVNEMLSCRTCMITSAENMQKALKRKQTYAHKHIRHIKQSKEDKDDDYEDSDVEAVSYHYNSDGHSQEYQSDDEDDARHRLANI